MSKLNMPKTSKDLALFCSKLIYDKLAEDIIILDLTKIDSAPADYFIICSSSSEHQSNAILDNILRNSKNADLKKPRVEGAENAEWILVDYFDVVVHIMLKQIRKFFKLEKLWVDAIFYKFNENTKKLNKINQTDTFKLINNIFND